MLDKWNVRRVIFRFEERACSQRLQAHLMILIRNRRLSSSGKRENNVRGAQDVQLATAQHDVLEIPDK